MHLAFEAMCPLNDGMPTPQANPALGRQQVVSSQRVSPEVSPCQELRWALSTQTGLPSRRRDPPSLVPQAPLSRMLRDSDLSDPLWYRAHPVIGLQGQMKSH